MATTSKRSTTQQNKVEKVMREYKAGSLHSGKRGPGKGKVVRNRKQAIAIALSEAEAGRNPATQTGNKPVRKTASSQAGARKTSVNRKLSRQTGGKQAPARATTARRSNRRMPGQGQPQAGA